jgi:large subunit ribosomal protein L10
MQKRPKELKAEQVRLVEDLINKYNVVCIAELWKVRAMQLQDLRKKFRDSVRIKVVKNSSVKLVIEKYAGKKSGLDKLLNHLSGSHVFLFTDLNPFKLSLLIGRSKIKTSAKTGDLAQDEIVIREGNTAISPGPIITELNDLGIRTKIETGSVWVISDSIVAKKGDVISEKLANTLSRLGIKPIEVGLRLIAAYDGGTILTGEQLKLDLNKIIEQIKEAHLSSYSLAVNAEYLTEQTTGAILQKAALEAKSLAIYTAYFTPETTPFILAKAHQNMLNLSSKVRNIKKEAVPDEVFS